MDGNKILQILKASHAREGGGMPFEQFMQKLAAMLKNPENKLLNLGDAVFLIRGIGTPVAEIHTFADGSPKDLIQAYKVLPNSLRQLGFKKALTYADSPGYVEIAKKTGLPVKVGQSSKVISGKAKPVYTFELDL